MPCDAARAHEDDLQEQKQNPRGNDGHVHVNDGAGEIGRAEEPGHKEQSAVLVGDEDDHCEEQSKREPAAAAQRRDGGSGNGGHEGGSWRRGCEPAYNKCNALLKRFSRGILRNVCAGGRTPCLRIETWDTLHSAVVVPTLPQNARKDGASIFGGGLSRVPKCEGPGATMFGGEFACVDREVHATAGREAGATQVAVGRLSWFPRSQNRDLGHPLICRG